MKINADMDRDFAKEYALMAENAIRRCSAVHADVSGLLTC